MAIHDIAFCIASFFLIGVAAASLGMPLWALAVTICVAAGIILGKKNFILAALLAVIFGGYGYFNYFNELQNKINIVYGEGLDFVGTIASEPVNSTKSQWFDLRLQKPLEGRVRVYTGLYPEYFYGQTLSLYGEVQKSTSGNLNIVSFPKISVKENQESASLKSVLFSFRQKIVDKFTKVLPSEESALVAGLTLGARESFSPDFKNALSQSGTTHIVALSGYNISLIGIAISILLGSLVSRAKAFYLSVIAIILFVVMTGAEASAIRAAIMGIIVLVAERSGRMYNFRNALVITAAIMVLFDPALLVFGVGFQLSFGALLGIVYIMPAIEKIFSIKEGGDFLGWKANGLTTLSAQLAVAPILLANFGQFNLLSIVANIFILEAVPVTMILGFLSGAAGFFSYPLSLMIAWLILPLLKYQIFIINSFSKLHVSFYVPSLSLWLAVIYYGLITAAVLWSRALRPTNNQL